MSKFNPEGLLPESVHHFSRKEDLKKAIEGYLEAELTVPLNWLEEHNNLVKKGYISADAAEARKKWPHIMQ